VVAGLEDHPGLTEGLPPGVAREEDVVEPVVPMALTVEVADQVYPARERMGKIYLDWVKNFHYCLQVNQTYEEPANHHPSCRYL